MQKLTSGESFGDALWRTGSGSPLIHRRIRSRRLRGRQAKSHSDWDLNRWYRWSVRRKSAMRNHRPLLDSALIIGLNMSSSTSTTKLQVLHMIVHWLSITYKTKRLPLKEDRGLPGWGMILSWSTALYYTFLHFFSSYKLPHAVMIDLGSCCGKTQISQMALHLAEAVRVYMPQFALGISHTHGLC